MRYFYLAIICFGLIQCSSPQQEATSTADSTTIDSANIVSSGNEYILSKGAPQNDSLANTISNAVDELAAQFENGGYNETISVNSISYESDFAATWHFDDSLQLKYCKGTWSSEGSAGSYAYYFKNGEIVALIDNEEYQEGGETTKLHNGFESIYGFSKTWGPEDQNEISYLQESVYVSRNTRAKKELDELLNVIRTNLDSATITDYDVSIHLENTTNYGVDFVHKEDYSITKALYNKLIKN